MPVRFDEAGGGYSAAADRATAAVRSHSTAAHHGALESEIAARAKRLDEAAAVAAAEAEAAAAAPLLDMFSPWRFPGQPTRPRAVHIGPTTVEIEWELLDGGGAVSGHQVRIDRGVSYFSLGCEGPSIAEPCCFQVMQRVVPNYLLPFHVYPGADPGGWYGRLHRVRRGHAERCHARGTAPAGARRLVRVRTR